MIDAKTAKEMTELTKAQSEIDCVEEAIKRAIARGENTVQKITIRSEATKKELRRLGYEVMVVYSSDPDCDYKDCYNLYW